MRTPYLAVLLLVTGCRNAVEAEAQLPLAAFAYDTAAPLNVQLTPQASPLAGVTLSGITYASPGGGLVTGVLGVPSTPGPHPGIVLLHGLPGHAQGAMSVEGLPLVQRGAVVLAINAPWVRRGGLPVFTPQDSAEQVQLMQDLQRAVDVLVARSDVDRTRLGYVGGSYGGAMGALFAGLERRLRAWVLFVPDGGLVAHFTNASGTALGPLASLDAAARDRWLNAMRPIEPIRFIHRSPPAAGYIQNGRLDQLVTVEDAEALHAAARQPVTIRWYEAGHGLSPAARTDRQTFLAGQLGLSP